MKEESIDSSDEPFGSLPENCIACILSFTSPRDTCRFATLSSPFWSAAKSDQVWMKFLPSDYQDVLSRVDASDPVHLSSKREIFFGLNDHILINGGKTSIAMDKTTGKICLMISAKEVEISQRSLDEYPSWDYHTLTESRFTDVAIQKICNDIPMCLDAEVKTNQLSDNTTYVVYLVYKLKVHDFGFDELDMLDELGDSTINDVYVSGHRDFIPDEDYTKSCYSSSLFSKEALDQACKHLSEEDLIRVRYYFRPLKFSPNEREGGRWMEVVLGEFDNNNGVGNVFVS